MRFLIRPYSTKRVLVRASNNLTSGIVGLANVGKSTFFQAITKSTLGNPANYPFATIDPEEAKVIVPSIHLDHLQQLYGSRKKIPATLTVFDIAGLTRNASRGEGLGNKFLSDIRLVDGIYSVVRGFRDDSITHIEGSVDPIRDMSVVQDELVLKDLEWLEAGREKLTRKLGRTAKNSLDHKRMNEEMTLLAELEEFLYEGRRIAHFKQNWTKEEADILGQYNFLTAKPTLVLLNSSPRDYLLQRNEYLDEVSKWIDQYSPGDELLIFSAEYETKYNEFASSNDWEGLQRYCNELADGAPIKAGILPSALPGIILKMRQLLHLISFYTCGPEESRQWTIQQGTRAPQAAGVIHSDLENTFINASVIKYDDLRDATYPLDESALRRLGKIKRCGKDYVVEDGDVVHFRAAAGKN
ncbi:AaceriABR040Wp [[Ashbya] aceris (nom. inval.)]|nr:AaceriABR040Wp [[Ashbya] aceris (nom. inval.)]